MENSPGSVPPTTRLNTQEVDRGVDHRWAAGNQTVAKRMLDYLNKSEVMKVDAQEMEFHVLTPHEPEIEHIVMHARGERHQRVFRTFSRQEQISFWSPERRDVRSIKGCSSYCS